MLTTFLQTGKTDERIAEVKKALSECFKVKDMGNLHYFLGVKVAQNYDTEETWIGQSLYTESILQKFSMEDSKPVNTPVDTSMKLVTATEDCETINQGLYQSAVGSLLYLSNWTIPDITYAVSSVSRFCSKPSKQH